MLDYWKKQTSKAPLSPELIWSRPENKNQAGKLLIIGGDAHSFAAPAQASNFAFKAGVGLTRVLLPHHVKKLLPRELTTVEFADSTPMGSFSRSALVEILDATQWADGVLIAGDLGKNSETAVLLESLIEKYDGTLTVTQDGLDYFVNAPTKLLDRQNTLLVATFSQLQKYVGKARFSKAFTSDMSLLKLVETLHDFSEKFAASIIVKHLTDIIVAVDGQISTTKLENNVLDWQIQIAAAASVWWLQNPKKPFEAITSSLITQA